MRARIISFSNDIKLFIEIASGLPVCEQAEFISILFSGQFIVGENAIIDWLSLALAVGEPQFTLGPSIWLFKIVCFQIIFFNVTFIFQLNIYSSQS